MSNEWTYLSTLLPNETVYSWCGTQHAISAGKSATQTSHRLLSYGHGPGQHELPAGLAKLPIFQPPYLLSLEDVLKRHTIGGYYWPWLTESARARVLLGCIDGQTHWRRSLCAQSRSRPFDHGLRWCPDCAKEDRDIHGRAYWHVEHQSPIARACARHQVALHYVGQPKKTWATVPESTATQRSAAPAPVLTLSLLSEAICAMGSITVVGLRSAILHRLQEIGVVASTRGVLHSTLEKWFSSTELAKWCASAGQDLAQLAGGEWIASMLWRQRRSHPVLWPVLWSALKWQAPEEAAVAFVDAASGRARQDGAQNALFDDHPSVATKAPEHVRSTFMGADSYRDVMLQLNVTRGRIVQWLEMDPELRTEWKAKLREGQQTKCEMAICNAVVHGGANTRGRLEAECAAEVRWMREHAPSKLAAMLKSMPARQAIQPTLFEEGVGFRITRS